MAQTKRKNRPLSRREFTRSGILAVAAAVPTSLASTCSAQSPAEGPALSTDSQTEVDVKVASIIRKYDKLLSNAEKLDVRRLVTSAQKPLDAMRLFPLDNADQPANVLRLYPDAPSERATASGPRGSAKG